MGTPDVSDKIRRAAAAAASARGDRRGKKKKKKQAAGKTAAALPLTSLHVLAWAMHNTVAATQKGVVEWAHQGLQHAATRGAPERALQPEVLGLQDM